MPFRLLAGSLGLISIILGLSCSPSSLKSVKVEAIQGEPGSPSSTAKLGVLSVRWRVALFSERGNLVREGGESGEGKPVLQAKSDVIDADFPVETRRQGSPAVSQDGRKVFVGGLDGTLRCLDSESGKTIWVRASGGAFDSTPVAMDEVLAAGNADGWIGLVRQSDGRTVWQHRVQGAFVGKPVFSGGQVYFMMGNDNLIAIDVASGAWKWAYKRDVPVGRFKVVGTSNPLVDGERLALGFADGNVVLLNRADGNPITLRNLAKSGDRFTDVDSEPVLLGGSLIVSSFSSGLFGLDPATLEEKWSLPLIGASSPAVHGSMLYISDGGSRVLAIDLASGKPVIRWVFKSEKGDLSRPVVAGRWLLVSSSVYSLIVLERASGKVVQVFNPGKGATSAPTVAGNRLFWVSNGETLYCMDIVP
jgi:outer membrane protein assembly factor BamB